MLLHGKKFKSLLILAAFVTSVGMWTVMPVIAQTDVNESEALKKQLKEKNEVLKNELQKSKNEIREEADRKNQLDKQIEIVKKQIDNSNQYILTLEKEISTLEDRIDQINKDMEKRIEILKDSLRSIYIAGDASAIDIILQAKNFDDFLDKAELVKSVSDSISSLIEQLKADLRQIEDDKYAVEVKKAEAEVERVELTNNQNDLQVLFDESEALLSELQKNEQSVKDQIDENDEELKKIENEIQQYYEQQRIQAEREKRQRELEQQQAALNKKNVSTTASVSPSATPSPSISATGTMTWPVPGHYYISSDFYDTVGRKSMHRAIDIAGGGIYGSKIVAADDGQVIFANPSGWGGGYGLYLIIDHGNGRSTLYAHMSGLAVQKGQTVKKGQVIGYVGSTGNSTGPHLHFETRLYGKKYNPMDEFKK